MMRSRAVAFIAFSLATLLIVPGTGLAQSQDPTPAPRWLEVSYAVEISEDLGSVRLNGTVDLHEARSNNQTERFCGRSCSADEFRELHDRVGPDRQRRLIEGIEAVVAQRTEEVLSKIAMGGEASAQADLNRSSIAQEAEGSPFQPAIPIEVTGNATLGGQRLTPEQIGAVFRMGARVQVQATVDPGTNLTLTLSVPAPLKVLGTGGGPTGEARLTEANWKGTSQTELAQEVTIGRPDVVVPPHERIDLDVVLDLSQVDVHYLQAMTGGTPASLTAELRVNGTIRAIETPTELQGVTLPYLSADAIRIGIANDLIPLERITRFEDEARSSIRSTFQQGFGKEVAVSGGFVPATLEPSAVGSPPGTGPPIRLMMSADAEIAIPPEQGGFGEGASGFEITRVQAGSIELPSIPTPGDRPANVTVILPDGVELAFDEVANGNVTRSTTDDGRQMLTFTSSGGSQGATIQGAEIVVNHPVVWSLFWPLIVFLLLVLVVLPAAIILYVRKERRKRRGANQERRSPVRGGYGDQAEGDESSGASKSGEDSGSTGPR